jgi:hypothetical protein
MSMSVSRLFFGRSFFFERSPKPLAKPQPGCCAVDLAAKITTCLCRISVELTGGWDRGKPTFAADDPSFSARAEIGRPVIERSEHDFRAALANVEETGAADRAEAPAPVFSGFALQGKCGIGPIRIVDERRSGGLSAFHAVASANLPGFAQHLETNGTATAAPVANPNSFLVESRPGLQDRIVAHLISFLLLLRAKT